MKKLLVLIGAFMLTVTFVAPVFAAEAPPAWSFYGIVRQQTYWAHVNDKPTPFVDGVGAITAGLGRSDSGLVWDLERVTSRFGANYKLNDISANIEFRPIIAGGNWVRQWNAKWNFGAGTLAVGQTWSLSSLQGVSSGLWEGGWTADYGDIAGRSRVPGVQFWFPVATGELKIAFLNPNKPTALIAGADTDAELPNVEAAWTGTLGMLNVHVFGGYNTSTEEINATGKDYDRKGWATGTVLSAPVGPFTFKGAGYYVKNPQFYGWGTSYHYNNQFIAVNDDFNDVKGYGFIFVGQYKLTDKVAFEVGYGWSKWTAEQAPGVSDSERKQQTYYLQVPITLTKGFQVIPEVAVLDFNKEKIADVTTERGKVSFAGIMWSVVF